MREIHARDDYMREDTGTRSEGEEWILAIYHSRKSSLLRQTGKCEYVHDTMMA